MGIYMWVCMGVDMHVEGIVGSVGVGICGDV